MLIHLLLAGNHRANHLLFLTIYRRHVQVEVKTGCASLTADIHQTIDTDGVLRERVTDVQVGERHAIHGIDGLQVQAGIKGIAAKGDGAALIEGEVLLDDVLDGESISAMIYGIDAKHVERSLVIEGGLNVAGTIKRDVVTRAGIHQKAHASLRRDVDIEIDVDIGGAGGHRLGHNKTRFISLSDKLRLAF